jgi:hypothetical protein
VIATSLYSISSHFVLLLKCKVTSAISAGLSLAVPLKIISIDVFALKDFLDDSPRTHLIASFILDFPEPFGPTIIVSPSSKLTIVFSLKDLNPFNVMLFKYIYFTIFSYAFFAANVSAFFLVVPIPEPKITPSNNTLDLKYNFPSSL